MSFATFFEEVMGHAPYSWQTRWEETLMTDGWPRRLSSATATGKTAACLLSFVYLLAYKQGAARRLFFVVDRRPVVDEAYLLAKKLVEALDNAAPGSEAFEVARRLREKSVGGSALEAYHLRGGVYRDPSWAKNPTQPLIVVSTVDQIGSCLLFRAYGASPKMAPIHAALVANDSHIVLDEVQCALPFSQTLESVKFFRDQQSLQSAFDFTLVSATQPGEESFRLTIEDLEDTRLAKRLRAKKTTRLLEVPKKKDIVSEIVKHATELLKHEAQPTRIGIIVNRVATAKAVFKRLSEDKKCRAGLIMGRMRPMDRDHAYKDWSSALNGPRTEGEKPLFVVSTQSLEAGPDLDFDAMVTECADIQAIVQRFGRDNRKGERSDGPGVILMPSQYLKDSSHDPIYSSALKATWDWLQAQSTEGVLDMSFVELASKLEAESLETLLTLKAPQSNAPVLLPAHLDVLSQTSPIPEGSPKVHPFLHGIHSGNPDVYVVWRSDISLSNKDSWAAIVEQCPPTSAEAMPVPVWLFEAWLKDKKGDSGDTLSEVAAEAKYAPFNQDKLGLVWLGEDSVLLDPSGKEEGGVRLETVSPGATIVLPSSIGGWNDLGYVPEGRPIDLGTLANFLMVPKRVPLLRIHPGLDGELGGLFTILAKEARKQLKSKDKVVFSGPWTPEIAPIMAALGKDEKAYLEEYPDSSGYLLTGVRRLFDINEEEDTTKAQIPVSLAVHSRGVEAYAKTYSSELLPEELSGDVTLSGWLHDMGKVDPRFQILMHAGNIIKAYSLVPLAKSIRGISRAERDGVVRKADIPKGWRHELASVALMEGNPALTASAKDLDLVKHLVESHHGRCRPFAPYVKDPGVPESVLQHGDDVVEGSTTAGPPPNQVAERFWSLTEKYGWWGLAYLEAILRLADINRSIDEQKGML